MTKYLLAVLAAAMGIVMTASAHPAGPSPDAPSAGAAPVGQQSIAVSLANSGKAPRLAIPAFLGVGTDAELGAAARTVADVLWSDLEFEQEFELVSREATQTVPVATSIDAIPYDNWSRLGAGFVVFATVQRQGTQFDVNLQLVGVNGTDRKQSGFGRVYHCAVASARACAHYIADNMHKDIRHLDGVAQTKIAFTSDRTGRPVTCRYSESAGTAKEIYIADYDGGNQYQITSNQSLNLAPSWGPDGRTLAYTSWASCFPDIYLKDVYDSKPATRPAGGTDDRQNQLAAISPDGTRIAFGSQRSGEWDIWIMNRDGSNLHNLTNARPGVRNDCPTWSPTGTLIAFTSTRNGSNQIYVMNPDGTGVDKLTADVQADHPTWSPAPFNDIAYTSTRPGGGHDVAVFDVTTRKTRIMTDGTGDNEQPTFAPNGRHLAFTTKRFGKIQVAILDRKGNIQRQVTKDGTNTYPNWSRFPR